MDAQHSIHYALTYNLMAGYANGLKEKTSPCNGSHNNVHNNLPTASSLIKFCNPNTRNNIRQHTTKRTAITYFIADNNPSAYFNPNTNITPYNKPNTNTNQYTSSHRHERLSHQHNPSQQHNSSHTCK